MFPISFSFYVDEESKRCIVALKFVNKDSFLYKITYCSDENYLLCESEEKTGKLIKIIPMQ